MTQYLKDICDVWDEGRYISAASMVLLIPAVAVMILLAGEDDG